MTAGKYIPIDPKAHKRILRFLNAARTPQELVELPQNEIKVRHEVDRGRPDVHEPAKKPRTKIFDLEEAERVFQERQRLNPLYGFTHLDQVEKIVGKRRFAKFTDVLTQSLSRATFGEWTQEGSVQVEGQTIVARHAAVLWTGLVLLIEGACATNVSRTPLWDPATRTMKAASPAPPGNNLYCSGHCFLSNGRLLAVGGGGESDQFPKNRAWVFDPCSESWHSTGDLNFHRWYPTAVTLGDVPGRVLVASGDLQNLCCEPLGTPCPGRAPAPPMPMEVYSEATRSFEVVTTAADKFFRPTYPGLHLLPGGGVFFAPVGFKDNREAPGGCPGNEESAIFEFTGVGTGSWTNVGANDRTKGMSALLLSDTNPFVQVITVGGGNHTNKTYRLINLSMSSSEWGSDQEPGIAGDEPSPEPWIHPNVVLLPDGTVFVCGGVPLARPGTIEPCWLYNPTTLEWSKMDELTNVRRYHSVAVLLPTGEVMATGGEGTTGESIIEIFRPPYLFADGGTAATRPVINTVSPNPVHHVETFTIETPEAAEIAKVVLVRPMAVTHQTDSEQRVIKLSHTQSAANSLSVTAPDGWLPHGLAPSGWYMLFILNGNGVPSEAEFVHLSPPGGTPRIELPGSISFGSVPQKDIRTRVMKISNAGSDLLSVSIAASPPPPQGQPLSGFFWKAFSAAILPGDCRDFVVEFSPRAEGRFTGTLSVVSNASGSPHSVSLRGRGLPVQGDDGGPIEPF